MSTDTNLKIRNTASTLFANHGFEGVSIRKIAKEAGVNIAAINYHFESKQALYWEVFRDGYTLIENEVSKLTNKNLDPEETVLSIFDILLSRWVELANTFKLILSSNLPEPGGDMTDFCNNKCGPPGKEVLIHSLEKNYGNRINKEGIEWITISIYSIIAHHALLGGTSYVKKFGKHIQSGYVEKMLAQSTESFIEYAKSNYSNYLPKKP